MKPKHAPNPFRLYSWTATRKATRAHIREAIRYAQWEKIEIGGKTDVWYESACQISREWRDSVRKRSLRLLAREHLEYWRMRAHMPGSYGTAGEGDRPAAQRWQEFSK